MSAPTLKQPSNGTQVKLLQNVLNEIGKLSSPLTPDGSFGGKTKSAVQLFQKNAKLVPDGIVGSNTWKELLNSAQAKPGFPAKLLEELKSVGEEKKIAGDASSAPWMKIALVEEASRVAEIKGKQHNPRIVEYHSTTTLRATKDETPWCASFVNWCMKKAGYAGTNSALAASWASWGQATEAQYGAVVVIFSQSAANSSLTSTGNHVGFLVHETPSSYELLGGNQNDAVKKSTFGKSKWQLKAMRWPA